MNKWTLQSAQSELREVVRLALKHEPQLVEVGQSDANAVVVMSRDDYCKLISPLNLYEALRASPLAQAVRDGVFGNPDTADPFARTLHR